MKYFVFFLGVIHLSYADFWVVDFDEHSHLIDSKENILFVSLGSTCFPAGLLRYSDLREMAFPFDWCLSLDNERISLALEENLIHFLDTEYLVPDSILLRGATGANLVHVLYHLDFVHEGSFRGEETTINMEGFQKRYQRRVERFRKLSTYPGTVIFIRCSYKDGDVDPHRYFRCKEILDISDDDAIRLLTALRNCFPNLKMKLLILNQGTSAIEGIVIEKIIQDDIWKARYTFSDEQKMYAEYKKFFYSLLDSNDTQ